MLNIIGLAISGYGRRLLSVTTRLTVSSVKVVLPMMKVGIWLTVNWPTTDAAL